MHCCSRHMSPFLAVKDLEALKRLDNGPKSLEVLNYTIFRKRYQLLPAQDNSGSYHP